MAKIPDGVWEIVEDSLETAFRQEIPDSVWHFGGPVFPLPWSHYVRLLSVRSNEARRFYEQEAIRGGWSIRQLDRQINSQFYERTALSRNKAAMLVKGEKALPDDWVTPEQEIKDPYVIAMRYPFSV